jgi:hypothetical protein
MRDQPRFNPYEAPEYLADAERAKVGFDPLPCPRCRGTDIKPSPYDAWHGRRAPKAIQDVTCLSCRCNYNGETGVEYPPRKNPIVWFIIALVFFVLYLLVNFFIAFTGIF